MGVEANDAQCMFGFPGSYEEKFPFFESAAALGHPRAAYWAGYLSEKGWGCPVDLEKAARYYRLALEHHAMHLIASDGGAAGVHRTVEFSEDHSPSRWNRSRAARCSTATSSSTRTEG